MAIQESPNYRAVVTGATYYIEQPASGYIRLAGPDRIDFLQRQTTNDVRMLAEDRAVVTVLTSSIARILDVYTLVAEADAIGVIPLPGRAQAATDYLRSRIFFMDDVTVEDVSSSVSQIVVGGPGGGELIKIMGIERSPDVTAGVAKLGRLEIRWVVERGLSGTCYRLLAEVEASSHLRNLLEQAGAIGLPTQTYEVLRIEVGLPAVDHELTEDFTPFEVGLDWAVSSTKGCYTGQEVLARQVTYDRVAKQLVGLVFERPVEVGDAVRSEDSLAGEVTSAVESPRFGPISLAVVRRAFAEIHTALIATTASGEVKGRVALLPFGDQDSK